MPVLTVSNLEKSYGPHDVFADVSLEVPNGAKIALVGPNGSGKTTLLHLMAGLDTPSDGTVHRAKELRIAYLPQQADFAGDGTLWDAMLAVFHEVRVQGEALHRLEIAMADPATRDEVLERYGRAQEAFERAGGYTYEQRIRHVLSGLGFDEDDLHRPIAQLSGGQKTRGLLARLLLEEPDLLLLDEPTNHLDLAGVEWLEGHLRAWKGAVVVVAHDRAFLDAVVERVWELQWGRVELYRGSYSAYVVQRAERLARRQAEYERQRQEIARTEDFIQRNMAGQRTGQAQGRQKRLMRVERIEQPREYRPMGLSLGKAARSGDLVLGLYELTVGYDPAVPLFGVEELELRRGQSTALLGPNGSGKTTLVRTVLGDVPPLAGRVRIGASVSLGYFAQGHTNLDPERSAIETILEAADLKEGEARNLLGRYRFSGDAVYKLIKDLSGGEQARVALACLTLQGANVLVLDEPTNHLDIPSQEVLQEALAGFGGTLLIVTHDRYLIRALASRVWAIEDGRLLEFKEGYDEYREWLERDGQEAVQAPGPTAREQERAARKATKREAARLARRQAEIEADIHRLETRQEQLAAQLAAASEQQAVDQVQELGAEYARLQQELDALLAAWTEAAA